jgi:hypothetical protein
MRAERQMVKTPYQPNLSNHQHQICTHLLMMFKVLWDMKTQAGLQTILMLPVDEDD